MEMARARERKGGTGPAVVAVVNVMRHSINEGDRLTAAGHKLAMESGRQAAANLLEVKGGRKVMWARGLRLVSVHSPMKRTEQTAHNHAIGFVTAEQIRPHLVDSRMHEKAGLNVAERLTEAAKKMTPAELEPEFAKIYRGEKSEHFESRESLLSMKRLGAVAAVVKNIAREVVPGSLRGKQPLLYLNYVTHGGINEVPGQLNMLAELITGKTP
ncbi:MAG: hypothetical protein NTY90_00010, partial [Candidatus Micrarchaeota archaeon]|nr:hypothetical protein [Candidatus Micrarchaeota archaeon]